MEAVHLRATDLAVLTRRFQCLGGLRLLCALFVHIPEYTVRRVFDTGDASRKVACSSGPKRSGSSCRFGRR